MCREGGRCAGRGRAGVWGGEGRRAGQAAGTGSMWVGAVGLLLLAEILKCRKDLSRPPRGVQDPSGSCRPPLPGPPWPPTPCCWQAGSARPSDRPYHSLHKLVVDGVLHKEPAGGDAVLAFVEEDGAHALCGGEDSAGLQPLGQPPAPRSAHHLHGLAKVTVCKDEEGRLPTQLQGDLLHIAQGAAERDRERWAGTRGGGHRTRDMGHGTQDMGHRTQDTL